jgi:hypothetical protein
MQFTHLALVAASLLSSVVSATNVIHFINQDSKTRTIVFTANEGLAEIEPLTISGLNSVANVTFPAGWTGNAFSVTKGAPYVPGMLAEVMFGGFDGATYFDVSAIVNPNDNDGIKILKPLSSDTPLSGCQTYPGCDNAYNAWDDVATESTDDTELVCLVGTAASDKKLRRATRVDHEFVTGAL